MLNALTLIARPGDIGVYIDRARPMPENQYDRIKIFITY